ncbi:MAG: substrate-binding domain-containing protein [Spirochaetaceae bacterium]|nr:substrate-binding domain-containing protein [Spirochaetaceae bacterium]
MAYRIALVLKYLDEEYQASVFRGAVQEAERLGIELVCIQSDFSDSLQFNSNFFPSDHKAFNFDGILFLSSILLTSDSELIARKLKDTFPSIPIVSIGTELKEIPSTICEAGSAINHLISHLIDNHGYKRFLYLGGPVENNDSQKREIIIKNALSSDYAKTKDCSLIIRNSLMFSESDGLKLIENYCQEHPERDVDVLLAGSDGMAMGIRKYLRSAAPESWKDCPITGFDDIPLAAFPPHCLTTIHQPADIMGAASVTMLHKLILGEKVPPVQKVSSYLVIRNSCGCNEYQIPVATTQAQDAIQREQFLRDVGYFGQEIMGASSFEAIERPLKEFLMNVATRDFSLVTYPSPTEETPHQGKIQLQVSAFGTVPQTNSDFQPISQILENVLEKPVSFRTPRCLLHLRVGNKRLGFITYSVNQAAHVYMCIAGMFLSHAVNRLFELEKEKHRARELEKEVQRRTQELKEEAIRRRNVEAEVLKISDLERQRFSMDLHDDICQRLAAMTMICKSNADKSPKAKIVYEMAQETLARTRQYAHASFPMEIDFSDISQALDSLCCEMTNETEISFSCTGEKIDLTREQKINVLRIAQEALQNAIKHSKAGKIHVSFEYDKDMITLSIQDDGCGYTQSSFGNKTNTGRRPRGLGIRSMEYRAHQIDGSFEIKTAKDKGTQIIVQFPVKAESK